MEVTSLEQSKALMSAGLKRETCDLWWIERWSNEWVGNDEEGNNRVLDEKPVTYLTFVNEGLYNTSGDKIVVTPAWSLGKLINMFGGSKYGTEFTIKKGGLVCDLQNEKWLVSYENEIHNPKSKKRFSDYEGEYKLIDAVVELMLDVLKSNVEL